MGERARRFGVIVPALSQVAPVDPLPARINHNRWIIDCPDCRGAEFVWLETPLMMCQSCWNSAVGGQWRRVALPTEIGEIEAILELRPVPQNRNWDPQETLDALRLANHEQGLPGGES